MIAKNYIGTRFGTRVCIDQFKTKHRKTQLKLKCDCGDISETTIGKAMKKCRSCASTLHGHSRRTPTYITWQSMLARCTNSRHKSFSRYGGAGIVVCDKWKAFDGFLDDMGERPEGTSLDRIDNALGYFKANCRWATRKQQQSNRRNSIKIAR